MGFCLAAEQAGTDVLVPAPWLGKEMLEWIPWRKMVLSSYGTYTCWLETVEWSLNLSALFLSWYPWTISPFCTPYVIIDGLFGSPGWKHSSRKLCSFQPEWTEFLLLCWLNNWKVFIAVISMCAARHWPTWSSQELRASFHNSGWLYLCIIHLKLLGLGHVASASV